MRNASRAALVAAMVCVSPFAAPPVARADASQVFSKQSFDDALSSTHGGKVLVVMFSAKWCGPCKAMEQTTWSDPGVAAWVRDHGMALHVDVDEDRALADRYSARALPLLVAFRDGRMIDRSVGYKDVNAMTRWLQNAQIAPAMDAATMSAATSQPHTTTVQVLPANPQSAPPSQAPSGQTMTLTTTVTAAPQPERSPTPTKAPPAVRINACERVQTAHEKMQQAMRTAKDQAGKNAARRDFRAAVGRIYAGELKAKRPNTASEVQVLATELDDTGWMRLALVQAALGANQRPTALGALLDQAQAKGVDVSKTRAKLAAAE